MVDTPSRKIAIIDGNSLMHRAYHAVPDTMNTADGTPTNAVFGFMSMLFKFIELANPDAIICAFDSGRPEHRIEELEQYKAQRPPMDEELRVQFPLVEKLLNSIAIPVVKVPGWEGDDILGTLSAEGDKRGWDSLLVTSDKDAYQLVSDHTSVVTTRRGITDVAIYGPEEVFNRYGVTPAQFPDYLGLKGDSSDNIPGVRGIGDKTAAKLLVAYDSLEGIYANLNKIKGKLHDNLIENENIAFLSRKIATIVRDLDLPLDLDTVAFPDFDFDEATAAFESLGFKSHLAKLKIITNGRANDKALSIVGEAIVEGPHALELLNEDCEAHVPLGLGWLAPEDEDTLFGPKLAVALDSAEHCLFFEGDEAERALAQVVTQGNFISDDVKAALHLAYPADTALIPLVSDGAIADARFFDVGVAAYDLDSSYSRYDTANLTSRYLGTQLPAVVETESKRKILVASYARANRLLADELQVHLSRDETLRIYDDFDAPLLPVLTAMERTGAAIDSEQLSAMGAVTGSEIEALRQKIYKAAGEEFNLDSPRQIAHILFEVLGLPATKRNARGYSTDASVLQDLAALNEVPDLILQYRELAKMNSTYIEALPKMRGEDGRLHTSYNATVTTTGRLSSSDPNLQNIPVRGDFGRRIRSCFVPLCPDERFLSADYSQIELRILAHLSGDEHLIAAFSHGADFHSATAARVFSVPVDEVTPEMRRRAKAVNFGIVYGQQAYGLSQSLKIPYEDAREMIDRYFEVYPGVRNYLDMTVEQARTRGYAETMFGRKRHIPELMARNMHTRSFGERTAMNHPMQGSAADIIKRAMIQVQKRLSMEKLRTKMILQVHDELDFSVPESELVEVKSLVKDIMTTVVSLKVPLVVDVSDGANWSEAH